MTQHKGKKDGKNFRVWLIRLQHVTQLWGKETPSDGQRLKNVFFADS